MLLQARAVLEKQLGPDDLQTIKVIGNLGDLYRLTGRIDKAEPLLRRYLTVMEQRSDPRTGETIEAYTSPRQLLMGSGRFDEAENCFGGAPKGSEAVYGPNHPMTLAARNSVVVLDQARGRNPAGPRTRTQPRDRTTAGSGVTGSTRRSA